ncbi:hypothetical protein KIW84_030572, partial [Lathyrus oleraceus]
QKYDAAIQLCDQSLNLAEKNFVLANSVNNSMHNSYSSVKMWRWSFISKCYFRLGKLDASLNVIEKLQQIASANDKCGIDNIEELLSLAATIQELLDHRKAGNENFKMGNIQKRWRTTLLLYLVISNHALLQQYVLATVLLHIKLQAKLLMPLRTAAWLWPLMEIMQRQFLEEPPCMRWLEIMNKQLVTSGDL